MYHVKTKTTKHYGEVIAIREYLKGNKWTTLKKSIGNSAEPITDEMLTDFIEKNSPDEVNLIIKDKKGEIHHIDFPISDLE